MNKQDIKDIIEHKEIDMSELSSHYDLISDLDYDGSLDEYIDSCIDIYYYSLRQWSVDNWEYVEQAMEEFGANEDHHKNIQMGQYLQLTEQAHEIIKEIFDEHEELEIAQ